MTPKLPGPDGAVMSLRTPVPGCATERKERSLSLMLEDIPCDLALEPLLVHILEAACTLVGAHDGAIGLYDRELDCIRTAASWNVPKGDLRAPLARGHGLMGRVLELDAPVYCCPGGLPHPTRTSERHMQMLAVPIRGCGEFVGVFAAWFLPELEVVESEQSSLEGFAGHAANAIYSSRRHELEKRRTLRFELIVRVAGIIASGSDIDLKLTRAADAIHEILGFPNVEISLQDVDDPGILVLQIRGGSYKRLGARVGKMSIQHGITGAAVRERRSQMVNDVRSDPRYVAPMGVAVPQAELAVPILFMGEALGVLNVEGPFLFDELDLQSLEVIAEHLAFAIQSARFADESRQLALLEERQRLARELHDSVTQILSSIRMISQTLAESWARDPLEGAIRTSRLSELAQIGFSQCHELLSELSPVSSTRRTQGGDKRSSVMDFPDLARKQDLGLAKAVDALILSMLSSQMDCRVDFSSYRAQSMECERVLFRVCQEAASNVNRHANASWMQIECGVDEVCAWVRISDDGRGISNDVQPGRGISNMWQRLLVSGGSFRLEARLPEGTVIEARLPRRDRTLP